MFYILRTFQLLSAPVFPGEHHLFKDISWMLPDLIARPGPVAALNLVSILKALGIVGGMALVLGVAIIFVFKLFAVPKDEKQESIMEILPGINCGGCGYSGCAGYAGALASGEDKNCAKCTPGGKEVSMKLSSFLGYGGAAYVPKVAQVACQGTCHHRRNRYQYSGSESCAAAHALYSGPASCIYGCIGLGDCERACPYDAIEMIDDMSVILPDKCVACGACVVACPKQLITLQPKLYDLYQVRCMNPDPGPIAKATCDMACIGCKMCVKKCPEKSIIMRENVALIIQETCGHCGICAQVCPSKSITKGLISPTTEESWDLRKKKVLARKGLFAPTPEDLVS